VEIYIISRKSATGRRAFQTKQMQGLGLDFTFVDAKEASDLEDAACQAAADNWPSPSPAQDIACFHSHRHVWSRIATATRPALVLEDDAVLAAQTPALLDYIDSRNDDWHCAYDLEYTPERHIISKKASWSQPETHRHASRIYQNRVGLAAYILHPLAASRMLAETTQYVLVDVFFWNRFWLRPYQIEPAAAVQMRFLETPGDGDRFERPAETRMFYPASKAKKRLRRLQLELTKARNALHLLRDGEKRRLEIDFAEFKDKLPPTDNAL
jgi:GR25 family glycosyltransferase involved in LPS biosynthesis